MFVFHNVESRKPGGVQSVTIFAFRIGEACLGRGAAHVQDCLAALRTTEETYMALFTFEVVEEYLLFGVGLDSKAADVVEIAMAIPNLDAARRMGLTRASPLSSMFPDLVVRGAVRLARSLVTLPVQGVVR